MAIYTKLTKSQIRGILTHFPALPQRPFRSQGIALGTVNTFYKLTFENKKIYYLKIDEVGQERRLKSEIAIFDFLEKQKSKFHLNIVFPLSTQSGKKYIIFQNRFALVFPELTGTSLYHDKLQSRHLKVIGQRLAEIHLLKPDQSLKPHRFALKGQKKVFTEIKPRLSQDYPEVGSFIKEKLDQLQKHAPQNLKHSLIHADLFPENIMWKGGKLNGILDFDAAGLGSPLFEIGVCCHALCHNGKSFDVKKIKAFLQGYTSVRPLFQKEKKYFHYFLDLTAMRFLLTRLRDVELNARGKKAKPYKDYREFLKRFEENQALHLDLSHF